MSKITTLDYRRANFGPFRDLLGKIPWECVLEERGVQENWSIFKHHFLQAREWCIAMGKKLSKRGRRPAQMNKELLKLRHKQEIHGVEAGTGHLG